MESNNTNFYNYFVNLQHVSQFLPLNTSAPVQLFQDYFYSVFQQQVEMDFKIMLDPENVENKAGLKLPNDETRLPLIAKKKSAPVSNFYDFMGCYMHCFALLQLIFISPK